MNILKYNNESGQTLLEVLIAFAIAALVLGSLTFSIIRAANTTQGSKNQNIATQYAQDGMELMRNLRNTNWGTFNSVPDGTYCFKDLTPNPMCTFNNTSTDHACGDEGAVNNLSNVGSCYNINAKNGTSFIRTMQVESTNSCLPDSPPANAVGRKVTVTVSWNDSKCTNTSNVFCNNVQLVSCLSNTTVNPTP